MLLNDVRVVMLHSQAFHGTQRIKTRRFKH